MNQPVILDISSDDEVGFDDSNTADNFDWISNFLEDVPCSDDVVNFPRNGGDDDSDDVVIVGEVLPKLKKPKASLPRLGLHDDDDCVMLNCDPDKSTEGLDKSSGEDSDDLVIIGEKGQVACRDYPHSRHLCAKFPFGSTAHESHCDLCHCYVCDSLAPCAHWGTGDLDHCSATDKVEYWQLERKKIRQLKNPPPPVVKPAAEPLSRLPQLQQTPVRRTLVPNPVSGKGAPRSFCVQNTISHSRSQRASLRSCQNNVLPYQIRRQLPRPSNGPTPSCRNSNSAPSMAPSRPLFKRPGFTGGMGAVNRSAYIPQNVTVSYWQQMLNQPSVAKVAETNSINQTEIPTQMDVNISSSGILPSHMQGNHDPVAGTRTSNFQGYGQSAIVTGDSAWVYPSHGSQAKNDSNSFIPSNTSNALNNVTSSSQPFLGGLRNVSASNFPCNPSDNMNRVAPMVPPPSEAIQNFSDSDFPYNTSNPLNGIAQSLQQHSTENPQVQDGVPQPGYLPFVEYDSQISGAMDSRCLDYDLNSWPWENPIFDLQNGLDLFFMQNQPTVPGTL